MTLPDPDKFLDEVIGDPALSTDVLTDEDSDTYMPCPHRGCPHQQWVSPEDQDASFGDLWNHVLSRHVNYDRDKTSQLMTRVRLVDEDGKPVKGGAR